MELSKLNRIMVWESKQQAALSAVERIFMKTLNFASRFEYGPVQRTIIELALKKLQKFQ